MSRGIPTLDHVHVDVIFMLAVGACFGLRGDRFWLRLRRWSLLVENGDALIFPASPRDHIAAVRTISINESPVSPQATQARSLPSLSPVSECYDKPGC